MYVKMQVNAADGFLDGNCKSARANPKIRLVPLSKRLQRLQIKIEQFLNATAGLRLLSTFCH